MVKRTKACAVCADPRRDRIAVSLFNNGSSRTAKEFGFKPSQMYGHLQHLPAAIDREREKIVHDAELLDDAAPLIARCERLFRQAERIASACRVEKQFPVAVSAIREARSCLELLAEMRGELARRSGVKVAVGLNLNGAPQPQPPNTADIDREIARKLSGITDGFKPEAIARLKQLAENSEDGSSTTIS